MFAMIEGDKVDLIPALPQDLKRIADAGKYRTLFTAGDARGPAETVAWAMRASFIAQHRAALVDFFEDHLTRAALVPRSAAPRRCGRDRVRGDEAEARRAPVFLHA